MKKKTVVTTYAVKLFKAFQFIKTKNSFLRGVVSEKMKKIKNMVQIFPHNFSKAVDRGVKKKEDARGVRRHTEE